MLKLLAQIGGTSRRSTKKNEPLDNPVRLPVARFGGDYTDFSSVSLNVNQRVLVLIDLVLLRLG